MMKKLTKYHFSTVVIALLFGMMLCIPAIAAEVDSKLQAAIFAKILNYDQSLSQKSGSKLNFLVVLDTGTVGKKSQLLSGFSSISGAVVSGKSIVISTTAAAQLSTALPGDNAHVIYLPDGTSATTLKDSLKIARELKIPVFCGNEAMVKDGAAVGLTIENSKPRIVINVAQSKAQGMNLSTQLLQLAKIIK